MLNEFKSNFFIADSLYVKFVLHEFAKAQNSCKERTPCLYYFFLEIDLWSNLGHFSLNLYFFEILIQSVL